MRELADLIAVPFETVPSPRIFFPTWRELLWLCDGLIKEHEDLAGIVVLHGTASLEETAYFLHLTLKVNVPVVLVGAQRPASALSTDAGMNLANAIRTAASPQARGLGVLALLNDEIQCAREVTKTSTYRLQTFHSPDFGVLGHADGDAIVFYRHPLRRHAPDTEFDVRTLDALPRVDIAYAYAGADGTAVRAFVAAGARGIVSAASRRDSPRRATRRRLPRRSSRASWWSHRRAPAAAAPSRLRDCAKPGFLAADNLNPQKARILLALALTVTSDPDEIERIFATY